MKSRLENILVDCLCNTLHVLFCSECFTTTNVISSLLCKYPVFALYKARTVFALNNYLQQMQPWECLIIDSRASFTPVFFDLVRKLPYWVPIVLLTDYAPEEFFMEKGIREKEGEYILTGDLIPGEDGEAINARKKIVRISPLRSFKDFLPTVQHMCLKKKLMSKMAPCCIGEKAFGYLFSHNPLSVDEWSYLINEPARKFQRMFRNYTDHSPKKLIALYHAYRIAFETLERHKPIYRGTIPAYIVDDRSKTRVMEYVLSRRSQLLY